MLRLNNRGWGIQAMMVCIMVLMIALIVVYILVQRNFSGILGTNYQVLETRVVEALKKYDKNNNIKISNGEEKVISVKFLKEQGLLVKFNKCSGYGIYRSENNKKMYKSYIKCGSDYTTDGYLVYLDEL